jgi:hypothetical protein
MKHPVIIEPAFSMTIGIIMLIIGWIIRYRIGQRRFNRRNFAGVEIFSSYGKATVTRGFETFMRFLGGIFVFLGIMFIVYGIIHS